MFILNRKMRIVTNLKMAKTGAQAIINYLQKKGIHENTVQTHDSLYLHGKGIPMQM